ncbi:MAG: hypothetical protein AVDCRST_MAG28-1961, partial [uncultured Rubrobacteraceae bacterium]
GCPCGVRRRYTPVGSGSPQPGRHSDRSSRGKLRVGLRRV